MASINHQGFGKKNQRTCKTNSCSNLLLGRSNQHYCPDCKTIRKEVKDAIYQDKKRKEQRVTVPKIQKYLSDNKDYFQKFDSEFLLNEVAFEFGLNKDNSKHLDMIRKAQTEAGVRAGYNIKIGKN